MSRSNLPSPRNGRKNSVAVLLGIAEEVADEKIAGPPHHQLTATNPKGTAGGAETLVPAQSAPDKPQAAGAGGTGFGLDLFPGGQAQSAAWTIARPKVCCLRAGRDGRSCAGTCPTCTRLAFATDAEYYRGVRVVPASRLRELRPGFWARYGPTHKVWRHACVCKSGSCQFCDPKVRAEYWGAPKDAVATAQSTTARKRGLTRYHEGGLAIGPTTARKRGLTRYHEDGLAIGPKSYIHEAERATAAGGYIHGPGAPGTDTGRGNCGPGLTAGGVAGDGAGAEGDILFPDIDIGFSVPQEHPVSIAAQLWPPGYRLHHVNENADDGGPEESHGKQIIWARVVAGQLSGDHMEDTRRKQALLDAIRRELPTGAVVTTYRACRKQLAIEAKIVHDPKHAGRSDGNAVASAPKAAVGFRLPELVTPKLKGSADFAEYQVERRGLERCLVCVRECPPETKWMGIAQGCSGYAHSIYEAVDKQQIGPAEKIAQLLEQLDQRAGYNEDKCKDHAKQLYAAAKFDTKLAETNVPRALTNFVTDHKTARAALYSSGACKHELTTRVTEDAAAENEREAIVNKLPQDIRKTLADQSIHFDTPGAALTWLLQRADMRQKYNVGEGDGAKAGEAKAYAERIKSLEEEVLLWRSAPQGGGAGGGYADKPREGGYGGGYGGGGYQRNNPGERPSAPRGPQQRAPPGDENRNSVCILGCDPRTSEEEVAKLFKARPTGMRMSVDKNSSNVASVWVDFASEADAEQAHG
eukprot:g19841.t1